MCDDLNYVCVEDCVSLVGLWKLKLIGGENVEYYIIVKRKGECRVGDKGDRKIFCCFFFEFRFVKLMVLWVM